MVVFSPAEGLSVKQITLRSTSKLKSATRTLKRKLEAGIGVSVINEELEKAEQTKAKDLALYEGVMKQLKDKFSDPMTSYPHKLQILTLSPFTWKRTQEEFGATSHTVKRKNARFYR